MNDRTLANASPWKRLAARRGLILKTWGHSPISSEANNPYAVQLSLDALLPLITPKTRLVAFTACSNILGQIIDIASVTRAIKEEAANKGVRKVEVCVDCVAYAPHRRIDVRGWDVEYCYFSYYKVRFYISVGYSAALLIYSQGLRSSCRCSLHTSLLYQLVSVFPCPPFPPHRL